MVRLLLNTNQPLFSCLAAGRGLPDAAAAVRAVRGEAERGRPERGGRLVRVRRRPHLQDQEGTLHARRVAQWPEGPQEW